MKGFNSTCRGESHIKSNKVCQDSSYCEVSPGLSIALVSDGHGGERYFRSDIGSQLACYVTANLIREFVNEIPSNLFSGVEFTQFGIMSDISEIRSSPQIAALRRLSEAIIANWRTEINKHAKANPATAAELEHVPDQYRDALSDEDKIAKVYGCTLIGYVQTSTYWFSLHIGDGKCFSFHKETGPKQPVLWDDACFLNKTTSLCDSNAIGEFRFTYQGDGSFPYAVVLGSDGLDDSFGEDKNLVNFYIQLLKMAYTEPFEKTKETVDADLPILSKRGSQDDMSISLIWDENSVDYAVKELTEWQLNTVIGELNQNKARIHKFHKERKSLIDVRKDNLKAAIDYDYALKEILSAIEVRKKLIMRYNALSEELNPEDSKVFADDIPYEKVIPVPEPITIQQTKQETPVIVRPASENSMATPSHIRYRAKAKKGLLGKKLKNLIRISKKRNKRR